MDVLQSWWEIPSIAHFCSLFRAAFSLPDFDIEELEEALLAAGTDDGSQFLEDLFCRLLQGCYGRDDIEHYNYEIYLKDVLKQRWEIEDKRENPLCDTEFKNLSVRMKVEVLHALCDFRLDAVDVMDQLKGLEGVNMRVDPLGKDSTGATYWYFYGSRLYKEDAEPEPPKEEIMIDKKNKHKNKEKREKKNKKQNRKKAKVKEKDKKKDTSSGGRLRRSSRRVQYKEEEDEEEEDLMEDEENEEEVMKDDVAEEVKMEVDQVKEELIDNDEQKDKDNEDEMIEQKDKDNEDEKIEQKDNDNENEKIEQKDKDNENEKIEQAIMLESKEIEQCVKQDNEQTQWVNTSDDGQIEEENKPEHEQTEEESKQQDGNTESTESTNKSNDGQADKDEIVSDKIIQENPNILGGEKNPRWHLICTSFEDWESLAAEFKNCKMKCEKELYKCITTDFLPAIPEIIEAREKERKKRMSEVAPRRLSSRIEYKRKEQEEQEKILAEAEKEETRQRQLEDEERRRIQELERMEEEKQMREERQKAREERARRLQQREQRARYIAEGKEIPAELKYTATSFNSKYREDDDIYNQRPQLDEETLEDMSKVLEAVKAHKDAWPFVDPVDEEVAPGYHDVIKKPMDISLVEKKLKNGSYRSTKRFLHDFHLIFDNCRIFNGLDSDLGVMASRLQKCFAKAVRTHITKDVDRYEVDEDFKSSRSVPSEKKYRPKRAASSRAMDTLQRAMKTVDDEAYYDDFDDSDDSDGSNSPKPYRNSDKIIRLEPPKLTPCRLIPELSPRHHLSENTSWSGVSKTSLKPISKIQGDPKWTVDGTEISFNGRKLLYNYSNNRTKLSSDSKTFSPYTPLSKKSSEKSQGDGSGDQAGKEDPADNSKLVTFNGKNFVYSFSSQSKSPKKSSKLEPLYKGKPQAARSSESIHQSTKSAGMKSVSGAIRPLEQSAKGITSQVLAGHGQSGGIVQVSQGQSPKPLGINLPPGSGQRIIKIVTPKGQSPSGVGPSVIKLSGADSSKVIRVANGMLLLEGQSTGIQIPGKARIIYQGNVTQVSEGISESHSDKAPASMPLQVPSPIISSRRVLPLPVIGSTAHRVSSAAGSEEKSTTSNATNSSVQSNKNVGRSTDQKLPPASNTNVQTENMLTASNTNLQSEIALASSNSDVSTENVSINPEINDMPKLTCFVPNSKDQKKVSDNSVIDRKDESVEKSDQCSLGPPILEAETTYIGLAQPSSDTIMEFSPMKPPSQLPKKRKIVESPKNSCSPPKIFIEGLSNNPSKLSAEIHKDKQEKVIGSKNSSLKSEGPSSSKITADLPKDIKLDKNSEDSLKSSNNARSMFHPFQLKHKSLSIDYKESTVCDSHVDGDSVSIDSADKLHEPDMNNTTNSSDSVESPSLTCNSSNMGQKSPTHEETMTDQSKKSSPDKGNLFDNFASFLQPESNTNSVAQKCIADDSISNSVNDNHSPTSTNNSQSTAGQSSSPINKPRLPQSMMDKLSTFAANLHTGSLASRLGSLSPTKSTPVIQSRPQYSELSDCPQTVTSCSTEFSEVSHSSQYSQGFDNLSGAGFFQPVDESHSHTLSTVAPPSGHLQSTAHSTVSSSTGYIQLSEHSTTLLPSGYLQPSEHATVDSPTNHIQPSVHSTVAPSGGYIQQIGHVKPSTDYYQSTEHSTVLPSAGYLQFPEHSTVSPSTGYLQIPEHSTVSQSTEYFLPSDPLTGLPSSGCLQPSDHLTGLPSTGYLQPSVHSAVSPPTDNSALGSTVYSATNAADNGLSCITTDQLNKDNS